MKRKKHLPIHALMLTTATMTVVYAQCQEAEKPNIIYILADDLGYGDLGCYGQKIIRTPNIDRLAKEGMLFTQHYSGCTVSAPSRCCLLTGLHSGHSHIRDNKEYDLEGQEPLPANTFTIAKMLQNAGYTTGCFGKWGLGFPESDGMPNMQGFDEFFGYNCQRKAHSYFPAYLWHNTEKIVLNGNEDGVEHPTVYAPDLIQEKTLNFIRNNKNNSFFLLITTPLPHAELISPKDSIYELYAGKIEEGTPFVGIDYGKSSRNGEYASSRTPHADFASMITRLDAYVGQILEELQKTGLEKNTLVIFTSDNGAHFEGGADPEFFNSNGLLRGLKRDLTEGGIRVPMIAWMPEKIEAESTSHHISAFWDMMPTFAEIAQTDIPKNIDGISILPTLYGIGQQKQHDYLYWEFHQSGGRQAVRQGKWKAVYQPINNIEQRHLYLYDLENDIHEDNDVAEQYPKIVKKMKKIMKKSHVESEIFQLYK